VQHEVVPLRQLARDVELVPTERVCVRENLRESGAQLAAGARDQDAAVSLSDRIGDCVLQRCRTRGSSQEIPCSSGSAGSYSSVTW
jgi:hypothetical protein